MTKQEFKILIEASPEKVWNILWNDSTYPEWTSVFSEGSHAETDWEKGSKVLFLNANNEGMVSKIADKIPNKFMSIKHVGTIKDGIEDLNSEEVKEWEGAFENYTLKAGDGKTELVVDMDITEEYQDYFQSTFPKALEKVKELAEKN